MGKRAVGLLCCLMILGAAGTALGGLVGHWTLDEITGNTVADSSGNGYDGTIKGNPTPIAGVKDGALEFHGTGVALTDLEYITIPSNPTLDIGGPISLTLWIRPDAEDPEDKGTNGGETAPMAKADSAASPSWSYQVRYGWGGAPQPFMAFTFNTSPRAWAFVGKKLDQGEWCHIAGTFDGTTLKCYLNGTQTDATPMGPITKSGTPVLIGSDGWGCDWLGAIDDVRIYNHGLTADEVAELCPPPRTAKNPNPADGAAGVQTPLLRWEAGYKGVMHEVYVGTSPNLGPNDLAGARSPLAMLYYVAGFQPGVTYYWRVDEIEADGVTVNTGNVWSFTAQALTAYLPDPADGATDASVAPTLTWQPGQLALKHHVYFGADLDAVTQGAASTDKGTQDGTTFAPGTLDSVATYYWRVDEIKNDNSVDLRHLDRRFHQWTQRLHRRQRYGAIRRADHRARRQAVHAHRLQQRRDALLQRGGARVRSSGELDHRRARHPRALRPGPVEQQRDGVVRGADRFVQQVGGDLVSRAGAGSPGPVDGMENPAGRLCRRERGEDQEDVHRPGQPRRDGRERHRENLHRRHSGDQEPEVTPPRTMNNQDMQGAVGLGSQPLSRCYRPSPSKGRAMIARRDSSFASD
jgi:hypothetical protein